MRPKDFDKELFYRFLLDSIPMEHYEYIVEKFDAAVKADDEYEEYRQILEGIGHG